jgi:hypothetical protein
MAVSDELSSPVCYAGHADDRYMGYAARDEVVDALNRLIEAERAGSRIASAWRKDPAFGDGAAFLSMLRLEEAQWCAMLIGHVRRLGGTPSSKAGRFLAKAMAMEGVSQRLAYLNRGQAWIVRTLDELTPRIRDACLHADLKRMRDGHLVNIASADVLIARQDQPPPSA